MKQKVSKIPFYVKNIGIFGRPHRWKIMRVCLAIAMWDAKISRDLNGDIKSRLKSKLYCKTGNRLPMRTMPDFYE